MNMITLRAMHCSQLIELIKNSSSVREVLSKLGFETDSHPRAWRFVSDFAEQNGLAECLQRYKRSRHKFSTEQAIEAIRSSKTWTDALEKLGLVNHGHNARTLQRIARENSVSIVHFNPSSGCKRKSPAFTYEQIFCEDSRYFRSSLAKAVKKFQVLEYCCEGCENIGTWRGNPLTLSVDHKNGISNDNRKENLRYLCPNCHAQTTTFGSKQRK